MEITLPLDAGGLELVELLRREGKHDSHPGSNFAELNDRNSELFKDPLHCFRCDVDGQDQCYIRFSDMGI